MVFTDRHGSSVVMTPRGGLRNHAIPSMKDILDRKSTSTITVVLPALNEERTIGSIVARIKKDLHGKRALVDELVVIDCGSADATRDEAARAGAVVRQIDEILPAITPRRGKGEALWRSLAATNGDIIAFIDSDLESFTPSYVVRLVYPLLYHESVQLVKAAYERPLKIGSANYAPGGGRVTETVARPLLNLYWPELAHLIQPLAGEYAARRSLLERLPFPSGYGVEIALLIDTVAAFGRQAISQVDLGVRYHRNRSDLELGRMASEIIQAVMTRLSTDDKPRLPRAVSTTLTQFTASEDAFNAHRYDVSYVERPPMCTIEEYRRTAS
jgi:glucosyl-3-phosphoglycerate synthase